MTMLMQSEYESARDKRWISVVFTEENPAEGGARVEGRLIDYLLTVRAADYVHLRKPAADREYITELLATLSPASRRSLCMHDHFDLAERYDVGGIQLNSRSPQPPSTWRGRVSRSCHSLEEIERYGASVSYLTLSPIFDSLSKQGYRSSFVPEELSRTLGGGRVVALGGVTPRDFPRLYRAGFGGGAMLGWMWRHEGFHSRACFAALRARLLRSFPFLLIADGTDSRALSELAAAAYSGGCRWVQVRMKDASTSDRVAAAKLIMERCPEMLVCIDDDCEAVVISGAHGVHLGKNDLSTAEARAIVGEEAIIGRTANSFDDVRAIVEAPRGESVDYIGMGPLRFTTTKKNLSPTLGYEGYAEAIGRMRRAGIYLPVLAIGAVTHSDLPHLQAVGVEGVAVSGAVKNASDPEKAAKELNIEIMRTIIHR